MTMDNMSISRVRRAQISDRIELAKMRELLWPDAPLEEHLNEIDATLAQGMSGTLPMAILVAQDENAALIGFLEVGLRSHADGCDPSHSVGYLEGWFVQKRFRNRGVGRELMRSLQERVITSNHS